MTSHDLRDHVDPRSDERKFEERHSASWKESGINRLVFAMKGRCWVNDTRFVFCSWLRSGG